MALTIETPEIAVAGATPSLRGGAKRLAFSQGFQYVARLGTSVVLARLLSPRDFGLLGLVSVLIVLLQRTPGGMLTALVQRERVDRALASSVFYFNVVVGSLITVILLVTAPWLSGVLGDTTATDVLRGMSLSFAIVAFAKVPQAMLRRNMRYSAIAALGSANAFVTGAVAIPLAVAGHGVAALVIGQLAATVTETAIACALARWRPAWSFRWSDIRSVSRFARNYTAFSLVGYLSDAGDKFIVGRWVGTAALGLYTLPYRLLFAPVYAIAQVYRDLLLPVFARDQHNHAAIARHYLRAVASMSLLTFPICAVTAALADPLIAVALGRKWHEAGPILAVMALVALLQSVVITGGVILTAKGRTDILLRWGLVSGVTMLAFYGVGTRWGATGVAVGFLAGTAVLAYPAMALPFRQIDLPVRALLRTLAPATIATAALGAAALSVRIGMESSGFGPTPVAVAGVGGATVAYGVALVWMRPPAFTDLLSLVRDRRSPVR